MNQKQKFFLYMMIKFKRETWRKIHKLLFPAQKKSVVGQKLSMNLPFLSIG